MNGFLFGGALARAPCQSEAADGFEAIDAFEEKPFRIVLLNMLMPNRDGLETIAELRKRWPATRIIAMSGGSRFVGKPTRSIGPRD